MSWIHAVIDVPADDLAATAEFWGAALGWPAGQSWDGHPELRSFEPPAGGSYLHLQRVDGPPRVHLDLESEQPDDTVDRAVDLGADVVGESDTWRTLQSPGGLAFCVLRAAQHEPPEAVTHPDGHRSRMVQVCVDAPAAAHDTEVAFWRYLLAARWVPSDRPEFSGKWHDDAGSPLQLLFQRLDEPDGPVRAHLDLGTDDLPAEVRRLLALGATEVGPGHGWHVLRDATGRPFCVTCNSPEQLRHRPLG
jgi:predicted enzyme related to lactoylglutathione lyase